MFDNIDLMVQGFPNGRQALARVILVKTIRQKEGGDAASQRHVEAKQKENFVRSIADTDASE
jgi:hypothetical protein